MSITIKPHPTHLDHYLVNGKTVFVNQDGQWESHLELTQFEKEVFVRYMNAKTKA